MNCRSFAEIASGIARAELMEASVQDEALEHVASCPRCEAHLEDERALSAALRSLAAADAAKAGSVDEAHLRAAFREGFVAASEAGSGGKPDLKYVRWTLGIAAASVLLFGASIFVRSTGRNTRPTTEEASENKASRKAGDQAPLSAEKTGELKDVVASTDAATRRASHLRVHATRLAKPDGSYVDATLGEFRPAMYEPEETTEFFPTLQEGDGSPMTSGQVVRVVVPRSAMNYFGLPINVDRSNEKVKADVLVGEDGLARAIRFVR